MCRPILSPGLYSPTEAMTSMPGAPLRSARFCSTRWGESVSVCATSPVAIPRPNTRSACSERIRRAFFILISSLWKEPYDKGKRTTHAPSTGRRPLALYRRDRVGKRNRLLVCAVVWNVPRPLSTRQTVGLSQTWSLALHPLSDADHTNPQRYPSGIKHLTLRLSRARKRERSERCRASAAAACSGRNRG